MDAGRQRVGDVGQQIAVAVEVGQHPARQLRVPLEGLGREHGAGAQRERADERPDLQPFAVPVREPEHVVEEPLFVVPHLIRVLADRVERGRDRRGWACRSRSQRSRSK